MTIRQIPTHLEIYFWTVVIRLISESKFVQHCLREAYLLKEARLSSLLKLGLVISGMAMLFGIILGLAGA
jgi:hypothetical protein